MIDLATDIESLEASGKVGIVVDMDTLIKVGYTEEEVKQFLTSFTEVLADLFDNLPPDKSEYDYKISWERVEK